MATIMIVEDDRQTNDAVAEYLKSFGYRMLSAYDGDEALQLFECNNIDLIILDIMIPRFAHGHTSKMFFEVNQAVNFRVIIGGNHIEICRKSFKISRCERLVHIE